MKITRLLVILSFCISLFLAVTNTVSASNPVSSVVLPTEENQTAFSVEIPGNITGIPVVSGNKPVPVFLAIDRISTQENDRINFILVCRNEGNESGNNDCVFQARSSNALIHEEACGNINSPGQTSMCRGSFIAKGDVYFTPYASNRTEKNQLLFKIPDNGLERGILVLFNSPSLDQESNLSRIPYYHALVNGSFPSADYGQYDWVLTGLKGIEDQEGNPIDKYPVNTKSFLRGEEVIVWEYNVSSVYDPGMVNNSVSNPGFENGLNNWTLENGNWSLSDISHTGNHSLYISSNENHEERYAYQKKVKLNPNTVINVSGWIKTKNIERRGDGKGVYMRIRLRQKSGTINEYTAELSGTNNWKEYNLTLNTRAATELTLYLYLHKSTGEVWFDDISVKEISNQTDGEIINVGEYEDTVYTLYDGTELRIEPLLNLDYSDEDMNTHGVIAGDDLPVTQTLNIQSHSSQRPQPLNLTPKINPQDYIKGSCPECFETLIIEPGSSESYDLSWKERGIEVKYIGDYQNASAISTPDKQHLIRKVTVRNANSKRNFARIEGLVYMDGTCNNLLETAEKLDWTSKWTKEHSCYFHVPELKHGETITREIGYFGDWIDLELGPLEQDPDKQSSLDRQYLRRELIMNTDKDISWNIAINLSNEMPGNCTDCNKIITIGNIKPVLRLSFNEGKGDVVKDSSDYHNNGMLKPNESSGPEWVDGKFGNALYFDGKDDYVEILTNDNLKPCYLSVGAWIFPINTTDDDEYIIANANLGQKKGFHLSRNNGRAAFWVGNDASDERISGGNLPENDWHYLVGIVNDSGTFLYVDGEHVASGSISEVVHSDRNYIIGQNTWSPGSGDRMFKGKIDEIQVYDKALSEQEIKNIYSGTDEKKKVFIHSSVSRLNYTIPKPIKIETDYQFWKQKIIVNNTIDLNFYNITVAFSTNLSIKDDTLESSENLTNLTFNDSKISFTIPKIKANTNNSYEIYFTTMKEKSQKSEFNLHVTGFIVNKINGFLSYCFQTKNLNEGLMLYLPFDGGRMNNVIDKSPYNHTGIIHGNPKWTVGKEYLALKFECNGDYIEIPDNNLTDIADKMTVSLWLRTGLNHDGTFLYQDGSGIHYRIRNDGHLRALINTEAGGSWLDYAGITDNEWHHIVVTYDGSEGRLYVDNNLADSVLLTGNLKTNANSLLIGTKLGDWYFNGMIDEIRIYNYSLSEAEIEGLYYGKEEIILFLHNPEFDYLLLSFIVLIAVIISIIELGVRRRCKP